jgi:hypothetical protein
MRISDISLNDVRAGLNWRVTNFDNLMAHDLPFEGLEIEPLRGYGLEDGVVYSGLTVHLAHESEPLGDVRPRSGCKFAPDFPSELREGQQPIVRSLLMVKAVEDTGWDYCELTVDGWRQAGLVPNPDAPLTHEYFANPLVDDAEFSIELEPTGTTIGRENRDGFLRWVRYLTA